MGMAELSIAFGIPFVLLVLVPACVRATHRKTLQWLLPPLALVGTWLAMDLRQEMSVRWTASNEEWMRGDDLLQGGRNALHALLVPVSARYWLGWFVGLGCVIWNATQRFSERLQTVVVVLFSACIPLRLLWGSVYLEQQWNWQQTAVFMSVVGMAIAYGVGKVRSAYQWQPWRMSVLSLLVPVAFAESVVLVLSGSQVLALMAMVVASTGLAGAVAEQVWHSAPGKNSTWETLATSLVIAMVSLGLVGCLYAEMTVLNALLIFCATLLPLPGHPIHSSVGARWSKVLWLGSAVMLVCSVGLAGWQFWIDIQAVNENPYSRLK